MIKKIKLVILNHARRLKVLAFFSWSMLMLMVGVVSQNSMGITNVYADGHTIANASIIRLDRARLDGENLGEFSPYEPDSGNLIARGYDYFYSADENFGIGVWESKPGHMTYTDLEYDELMLVLEGSLIMTNNDGEREIFEAGEGLVLPQGWSGTLTVTESGVRKIWVSYMGGTKGK